jgi:hypothetical protein
LPLGLVHAGIVERDLIPVGDEEGVVVTIEDDATGAGKEIVEDLVIIGVRREIGIRIESIHRHQQ